MWDIGMILEISFISLISRTRIKNGLAKDIYGIEIDEEQYKKCIDNLDEVLKRNDIDKVDWKVINADYLKWNTTIKFQYIVGNPPYITYSELKEEEQLFVKSNFSTCVKGKFDYCYAFIEKGINSLADNGKMSYLIPSSIYKTVFGHNLRIFMSPYIAQIKDYKQVKIFDKALVKSSIMILDKQRQQEFLHYQDMSMENAIDIPIAQLDEKWFFADENEVGQHRFGDYFKVSHVVATLLNKAYVLQDGTYIEVEKGYVCGNHTIERAVIRSTETPRTLRYGKHEKIIFPYTYDENGLVRFGEGEFERLYPEAAAYLNEFRDDLSKRQSDNSAKWYEYGRSQALSGLNSKKLLISTVVTNDVDVYELEQECIFYNLIINSIEAFSKSSTKNRKIRIELKTNENLVVNYLDNGDGLDNKFKNPYEIFTLGSTSKYDQLGRHTSGEIYYKTALGKYMFYEMKLYLQRHQLIYNLGRVHAKLKEVKKEIDRREHVHKPTEDLTELYKELCVIFFEYYNAFSEEVE